MGRRHKRADTESSPSLADLAGQPVHEDTIANAPTSLIRSYLRAFTTPIDQLANDQLRVLVSQDGPTEALLPTVLARLEQDPLLEGTYYPGDVLCGLLQPRPEFWAERPAELERVLELLDRHRAALLNEGEPVISAIATFEGSVAALVLTP